MELCKHNSDINVRSYPFICFGIPINISVWLFRLHSCSKLYFVLVRHGNELHCSKTITGEDKEEFEINRRELFVQRISCGFNIITNVSSKFDFRPFKFECDFNRSGVDKIEQQFKEILTI